jgi:hypothetical protein
MSIRQLAWLQREARGRLDVRTGARVPIILIPVINPQAVLHRER